jgi:hypothetical protein
LSQVEQVADSNMQVVVELADYVAQLQQQAVAVL